MLQILSRILILFPLAVLLCLTASSSHAIRFSNLTVAHSASYPPFSYIDEKEEPQGYLIDYWKHFGEANNVDVTFRLGSWGHGLKLIQSGKADLHAGLFYSEERDDFLDYGQAITSLTTFMYLNKNLSRDEAETCKIGVIKGGYTEYYMRTERPERNVVMYSRTDELIQAAADGEIMAFLADQPTAVYYLRKFQIEEIFTSGEKLYTMSLQVAVKQGNEELLEFIDRGWSNMDSQKLNYLHNKWFLKQDSGPSWMLTATLISVVVLFLLLAIRMFRRQTVILDSD